MMVKGELTAQISWNRFAVSASHRSFFVNEECIICNRKIDGKKSSNLRRHLERFHPQELAAFDRASPSTRSKKDEIPADKGSELQNELVDFFISSRIPLENLYNEHFRVGFLPRFLKTTSCISETFKRDSEFHDSHLGRGPNSDGS